MYLFCDLLSLSLGCHLLLLLVSIVSVSLRRILRARRVHHGVRSLARLSLRLFYVRCSWLLLLARGGCLLLTSLVCLLLFYQLLLLKVLLLLLVRQVLRCVLGICIVIAWILHNILVDIPQVFQHIDQLRTLLLHICLVSISDKVHVDLAASTSFLPTLSFVSLMVKRVLLVKMIKIFIADLARH